MKLQTEPLSTEDECGGCNGNGICDTVLLVCQCDPGYTLARDCSLNDYEVEQEQELRLVFLDGTNI
jgi:hypothetical protein